MDRAHCNQHPTHLESCLHCSHAYLDQLRAQTADPEVPAKKVERGVIADRVVKKPPVVRKPVAQAKPSDLLTVTEAARMLGLKETTVRDWILRRKIDYLKLGAKAIRIRREVVERFLRLSEVNARPGF
jgi:excisionase family DNA binding protein